MCKRIIKIIFGLLIDCAIVYCLFSLMPYFFQYNIMYLAIIAGFYVLFAWYNRWTTPGIKLITERRDKKNSVALKRKMVLATFLDWFSIYSLMLILNLGIRQFVFINSFVLFTIIALLYYTISYLAIKQTIGYYFCGIELTSKQKKYHWAISVIARELSKFGLGAWLPFCLFILFRQEIAWYSCAFILLFNVFFLLFYYALKSEAWWNAIGKTVAHQKNIPLKSKRLFRCGYLICIGLCFGIFLLHNNINNPSSDKILGFNVPFKRIEYPDNCVIKPYTAFLKAHAQDPKEYLLSLFEKYDIVILCEHLHTEDTQWDFIYDVVTDARFVKKIGHIFTEYGCAKDQAKVDSFMRTSFADSISLAKEAATLMRYHSKNFHYFMQKLHQFNRNLPDSLQVHEHFTDILTWKYLYGCYSNMVEISEGNCGNRDSLMANVIINWHKETGRKCLVVTNYRHAFALKNDTTSKKYENEAQYIYDEFPEKTANVLIHGSISDFISFPPIHHGKWDRVMKNNGNTPVGFDLVDSPFGNDKFDLFPITFRHGVKCLYQDIFNGYIFYKPEEELTHSFPYYQKYAAEKEYEWAVQNHLIDSIQGYRVVNSYQNTGGKLEEKSIEVLYLKLYHLIDLLLWGLWAGIVFLISVSSLGLSWLKRNQSIDNLQE